MRAIERLPLGGAEWAEILWVDDIGRYGRYSVGWQLWQLGQFAREQARPWVRRTLSLYRYSILYRNRPKCLDIPSVARNGPVWPETPQRQPCFSVGSLLAPCCTDHDASEGGFSVGALSDACRTEVRFPVGSLLGLRWVRGALPSVGLSVCTSFVPSLSGQRGFSAGGLLAGCCMALWLLAGCLLAAPGPGSPGRLPAHRECLARPSRSLTVLPHQHRGRAPPNDRHRTAAAPRRSFASLPSSLTPGPAPHLPRVAVSQCQGRSHTCAQTRCHTSHHERCVAHRPQPDGLVVAEGAFAGSCPLAHHPRSAPCPCRLLARCCPSSLLLSQNWNGSLTDLRQATVRSHTSTHPHTIKRVCGEVGGTQSSKTVSPHRASPYTHQVTV